MSMKTISKLLFMAAIGLMILGFIFKTVGNMNKGVSTSTGVTINGHYVQTESGRLGANREKYNTLSTGGTIFYVLGGITLVTSIVIRIKNKED